MGVAKRLAARHGKNKPLVVRLGEHGPQLGFDCRVERGPLPTAPPPPPAPAADRGPRAWLAPGEHWVEPSARLVAIHCESPGRCCRRCGGSGCKACLLLGHGVEVLALGRHLARRGAELVESGLISVEEAGLAPVVEPDPEPTAIVEEKPPGRSVGQGTFGW